MYLCSCSSLQPLQAGTKVSDVVALEIEVKGSTEPYQVLLEPNAVVIPGEIFILKETRRNFMVNSQTCTLICLCVVVAVEAK